MDLVFIRWQQGFVSLKSSKDSVGNLQCQNLRQFTKHHHQVSPVTDSIIDHGLIWYTANGILCQLCLAMNHRETACRLQGHTELDDTYACGRVLGMLGLINELLTPASNQGCQFDIVCERRPIVNFFMLKYRNKGTSSILNRLKF